MVNEPVSYIIIYLFSFELFYKQLYFVLQLINFSNSALQMLEDNVDARLTLASLLLEEAKEDEAIALLTPPKDLGILVLNCSIPYKFCY